MIPDVGTELINPVAGTKTVFTATAAPAPMQLFEAVSAFPDEFCFC